MTHIKKAPLHHCRIRKVPRSGFSWIDRRLITDGFGAELPQREMLLYLFLCVVSDKDGLSFYGDQRLCALLKMNIDCLDAARRSLEKRDLILYRYPLYQVLAMPDEPTGPLPPPGTRTTSSGPSSIGDIIKRLP